MKGLYLNVNKLISSSKQTDEDDTVQFIHYAP
jgi:hypothetical protein